MTLERRRASLALTVALLAGCALPQEPSAEPLDTCAAALTTSVAAAPPPLPPPPEARLRVAATSPKIVKSCGECSADYTSCLLGCGGDWNCAEACAGAELLCWDHCVPDGDDPWPPRPGELEHFCDTHPDADICRFTAEEPRRP